MEPARGKRSKRHGNEEETPSPSSPDQTPVQAEASAEAAAYSASRYRTPDGAPTDIVIFTIATSTERDTAVKSLPERELQVLLIRRKAWPFEGQWALPGGFCQETETLRECAERELREETRVEDVHMAYFNAYSTPGRDPRGWMISHAFFALVAEHRLADIKGGDDAAEAKLFPVREALDMPLAFDHGTILRDAMEKLRDKMLTTTIAKEFLPESFTLSELYQVIRAAVPDFVEMNFIRKVTATRSRQGILEEVRDGSGRPLTTNRHSQRPAQLYRFTDYSPRLSLYS